jgi:hypothetical protein
MRSTPVTVGTRTLQPYSRSPILEEWDAVTSFQLEKAESKSKVFTKNGVPELSSITNGIRSVVAELVFK